MDDAIGIVLLVCLSVSLKVLLIPCYTSTDFEVHRNWLAITHTLPHKKWYFEKTSEWTLDYPPLFAWFECSLSYLAAYFDPAMLKINNLNHKSNATLYFQRGSVIVTELLLIFAGYKCFYGISSTKRNSDKKWEFLVLLAFNCGLLIVDHIHFQYNGFLFGILFLSFASLIKGSILWSAFWFSVLLNFKHIFLYIAPAYGIFFIRTFCMDRLKSFRNALYLFQMSKLFMLATIVLGVFAISFGPFINDIIQVFSRLFPFKRGLTHAYWAPNFWALYNAADKILTVIVKQFGFLSNNIASSSSSGLVQSIEHTVLPSIPPILTFLLTFVSMVPCLLDVFFRPKSSHADSVNQFLRAVSLCSLCSYMFGWHVHEKAILMAVLPSTLLSICGSQKDTEIFLFLQTVGHYSLFPLLFTSFETPIKICIILLYSIFAFTTFSSNSTPKSKIFPCISTLESIYLCGLIVNEIFCSAIFPFLSIAKRFEFLPLMLTSVYSALGITWSWLRLYHHVIASSATSAPDRKRKKKQK